jgi:hypothetical protein
MINSNKYFMVRIESLWDSFLEGARSLQPLEGSAKATGVSFVKTAPTYKLYKTNSAKLPKLDRDQ